MKISEMQEEAWETAEEKGFHDARGSEDIVIRFAGEGPDMQFVDVENKDGESIDVGGWEKDGEYQLLHIERGDETLAQSVALALLHSEISEALESLREDDHENFAEELADIIIRAGDLAGTSEVDLQEEVAMKMAENKGRDYKHGKNF